MHIPFFHTWKIINVEHYNDVSWGGKAPSTTVVYKCKCGKIKSHSMYGVGFLTLEDLSN